MCYAVIVTCLNAVKYLISEINLTVTDCELVVDRTGLVATHRYFPASVDALLFMVSDGVFTFPPEYSVFSVVLRFPPLHNQCIS